MELLLVLVVVGGIWWYVSRQRREREAARRWLIEMIEKRMIDLFVEFPDATDAQIAILARDAMLNSQVRDESILSWASEETAARIRRLLVRELALAGRGEAAKQLARND